MQESQDFYPLLDPDRGAFLKDSTLQHEHFNKKKRLDLISVLSICLSVCLSVSVFCIVICVCN